MTGPEREREILSSAFARAQEGQVGEVPPFSKVWSAAVSASRPQRQRRVLGWAAPLSALVLVAAVVVGIERRSRMQNEKWVAARTAAVDITDWQAPLDFLLETPGSEWLHSTPTWDVPSSNQEVFQ